MAYIFFLQDTQSDEFVSMLGALLKLVTVSIILERGLAFIFEHKWFRRAFGKKTIMEDEGQNWESWFPGVKETIAISVSLFVTFYYKFDILQTLFEQSNTSPIGFIITAFVIAGGSAGAISIFQGYLKMGKEVRDANIAANQAEAKARKVSAVKKIKSKIRE